MVLLYKILAKFYPVGSKKLIEIYIFEAFGLNFLKKNKR